LASNQIIIDLGLDGGDYAVSDQGFNNVVVQDSRNEVLSCCLYQAGS